MNTVTSVEPEAVDSDRYRDEYERSFVDKWDDLIDWEARAEGEQGFFEDLLLDAGCERVLDAAAGTGYHSVQLAQAGLDVVAADGAETMLAKTEENLAAHDLDVPTHQADWRHLAGEVPGRFDAVLCLGNALTHVFDRAERRRALEQFHRVLRPGGLAVVDQRNYDAILDQGYSSKHRYYYCGDDVEARPETISEDRIRFRYAFPDGSVHHLTLYPLRVDHLTTLMEESGLEDVRRYGDFESDYDPRDVDFVVQVGRRR